MNGKTLRFLHKWIGAAVGIFFLSWTVSGIVLLLPERWFEPAETGSPARVDYRSAGISPSAALVALETELGRPMEAMRIDLRPVDGKVVYEIVLPDGSYHRVDSSTGQILSTAAGEQPRRILTPLGRARNAVAGLHTFLPLRRLSVPDRARKGLVVLLGGVGIGSVLTGYFLILQPYQRRHRLTSHQRNGLDPHQRSRLDSQP